LLALLGAHHILHVSRIRVNMTENDFFEVASPPPEIDHVQNNVKLSN
jgi:hypothetical protein